MVSVAPSSISSSASLKEAAPKEIPVVKVGSSMGALRSATALTPTGVAALVSSVPVSVSAAVASSTIPAVVRSAATSSPEFVLLVFPITTASASVT